MGGKITVQLKTNVVKAKFLMIIENIESKQCSQFAAFAESMESAKLLIPKGHIFVEEVAITDGTIGTRKSGNA